MSTHDDYRENCAKIISDAIERPSLYYNRLREFEFYLLGHFDAFSEIFSEYHLPHSFSADFSDWLWKTKNISCSSGWGMGIEKRAKKNNIDHKELFAELVEEFLPLWLNCPDGNLQADKDH